MRLTSFNMLHGRSARDGRVDADRLRAAVRALDSDVLALQEVDRDQPRSGGLDLVALVAEATGAAASRFLPTLIGTPGFAWRRPDWTQSSREAADGVSLRASHAGAGAAADGTGIGTAVGAPADAPGEPAYGVGLVSRRPVERWVDLDLGASPARLPLIVEGPAGRRVLWVRDEPRAAVAAVLAPGGPVRTVVATHLSFAPGVNLAQLRRLRRALRTLPGPLVLLGDLNLPGRAVRVVPGWRPLVLLPTYPADEPRVQLDHVLLRTARARAGAVPTVVQARTERAAVSDHRALVVDLAEAG